MANGTTPSAGSVTSKKVLISELNWKYIRSIQLPTGSASTTVNANLLQGFIIKRLKLNLNYVITATAATAAFTTSNLTGCDGWSLIRNLTIQINGGTTIRTLSGEQLYWWNVFQGNTPKQGWSFSTASPYTATFNSTIDIPFALMDLLKPLDTCLDARLLNQNAFTIQVTYGTTTNVIGSSPAGATGLVLGNVNATIYQDEFASGAGGFSPSLACLPEIYTNTYSGPVTNALQPLVGAIANKLYYSFIINVKSGIADAANILENIQLFSGGNYMIDTNPYVMTQQWLEDHDTPWNWDNSTPIQATGVDAAVADANYYIATVPDGYLHGALDVTDIASLNLAFTTNAACTVTVVALTIR